MEYSKLVAVTGLPGLFELMNSKSDGAIVRSLNDKTTRFVSNRIHSFTHLESIEIYTVRDNVNLVEVFHAMEKNGGTLPDDKDATAVKKYFEKAYPDMDFERVYGSDMKKMVKWFDVLKKNNIEIVLSEEPEEAEDQEAEVVAEDKPEKKTVPTSRQAKAKKETADDDSSTKAPTAKKTARKKKAE